jgi:hypothetical protein
MDRTISHPVRNDLEGYDKWKLVTPRRPKVKIGDGKKERKKKEKVSECAIQQTLILKNPYVAPKN